MHDRAVTAKAAIDRKARNEPSDIEKDYRKWILVPPWNRETGLSPPVKYLYWQFQGGTSFVDLLGYLCLVLVILLRLFIAALWSPVGKGLTAWLSFVMLNCV